jgi:hypothetical protein
VIAFAFAQLAAGAAAVLSKSQEPAAGAVSTSAVRL